MVIHSCSRTWCLEAAAHPSYIPQGPHEQTLCLADTSLLYPDARSRPWLAQSRYMVNVHWLLATLTRLPTIKPASRCVETASSCLHGNLQMPHVWPHYILAQPEWPSPLCRISIYALPTSHLFFWFIFCPKSRMRAFLLSLSLSTSRKPYHLARPVQNLISALNSDSVFSDRVHCSSLRLANTRTLGTL